MSLNCVWPTSRHPSVRHTIAVCHKVWTDRSVFLETEVTLATAKYIVLLRQPWLRVALSIATWTRSVARSLCSSWASCIHEARRCSSRPFNNLTWIYLPTTSVVVCISWLVGCVCVCVCVNVCVCVRIITFKQYDRWPKYLACWFILKLSMSNSMDKVRLQGHRMTSSGMSAVDWLKSESVSKTSYDTVDKN